MQDRLRLSWTQGRPYRNQQYVYLSVVSTWRSAGYTPSLPSSHQTWNTKRTIRHDGHTKLVKQIWEGPEAAMTQALLLWDSSYFSSCSFLKLSPTGPLPTDQQLHAWGSGKIPDHQSTSSFLVNGRPPVLSAQLKLQRSQFSKIDSQPHFRYHCLYFETGLYYFIWATTRSTIALQCSCGNVFRVWSTEPTLRNQILNLLSVGTKFCLTPNLLGRCQFLLLYFLPLELY